MVDSGTTTYISSILVGRIPHLVNVIVYVLVSRVKCVSLIEMLVSIFFVIVKLALGIGVLFAFLTISINVYGLI